MKYNLSMICKTANAFYKKGYSRSAAFVLAWRLSKQTASVKISGTSYGDRQQTLSALLNVNPSEVSIELHRERNNIVDHNAVAVVAYTSGKAYKLGYIPARAAALIAPIIDAGHSIKAALSRIVGGYLEGMNYGARLTLAM